MGSAYFYRSAQPSHPAPGPGGLEKGTTMIERIDDMPTGTIGFKANGKLTRDDYREILEPTLRKAAESGEIRMLFML